MAGCAVPSPHGFEALAGARGSIAVFDIGWAGPDAIPFSTYRSEVLGVRSAMSGSVVAIDPNPARARHDRISAIPVASSSFGGTQDRTRTSHVLVVLRPEADPCA